MTDMTNIKMEFWGEVNIEKMFDIHDNDKVVVCASQANSKKPRKQTQAKEAIRKTQPRPPMTLCYFRHGNKGMLERQRRRVDILYMKWTEWGWIDRDTRPEDFDAFFEGEPRHCNIAWTANTTVLTILLQEVLKQDFAEKQTGCSAASLVRGQFGKTPNSDRTRLDQTLEDRIRISLLILDPNNPLPEPKERTPNDAPDISDAALFEIYQGKLRNRKSV